MGAERPIPEQEKEPERGTLLFETDEKCLKDIRTTEFTFNATPRPQRDTLFATIFITTVLTSYAIGFCAIRNADPHPESKLRYLRYNPESKECERIQHAYMGTTPTHFALLPERKAYETGIHEHHGIHLELGHILFPVLLTLALVFPVGLSLLYLLHRYTRESVLAILTLTGILPMAFFLIASFICLTSSTCSTMSTSMQFTTTFLSVAAIVTFLQFLVVCKKWSQLDLTVQILKTSLESLRQNLSLLLLNPVMGFATVMINTPIGVFMWYASFNGKVAPNFDAIRDPANECSLATGAPCCHFQRSTWVTPYLILSSLAMVWVVLVAGQLQILVVSGTVSQWYFAVSGSSTNGTTKRAVRNAFGSSFGTACLSSLLVTVSLVVRSLMDRAVGKIGPGIMPIFLRACFGWFFQVFEIFTRFTTNFAAISGDGFCTAARAASELLRRNWLSTLIVEVLVQYVFTGVVLTFAMLHFFVVWGLMQYFGSREALMTANVSFLVALLGLGQLYQAMAAVIDTVYICYAMDKDVGVVSKVEVHDVYMLLPAASSGEETMLAVRSCEP